MLLIHRSARAGPLVAALGKKLSGPSSDPFAPELIAVPSMGVERWLAQQLSHILGAVDGDGVCANVVFPSSNRLLDDAIAAADDGYAAAVELWSAERVVWPLMTIIDRNVTASWAGMLAAHLGLEPGGQDRGRRFAVAGKLAGHFASYGQSRPAMLQAWRDGRDEQGDGTPLPNDLTWQAELWRLARVRLGPSPAELLDAACAKLLVNPQATDLPLRFSIFGTTRITPTRIAVLTALCEHREVNLWLNHPSPALWHAVQAGGQAPGRRAEASAVVRNPLLASLSRDIRELQQLLPAATSVYHDIGPRPDTVLGLLQQRLADDTVAAPTRIAERDRTLTVHACHGPARQVEVVREVILGLLEDDPSLEPRDILIMCPDVETFAPLVAASFGLTDERSGPNDRGEPEDSGGHPAARLRVRLADRSLRQTNPLLSLLSQLLELAANRATATQLLDLAGAPPVRARFGFTDDDIEQLRDWTTSANARWGLDAKHRAPYGLGNLTQGTWRAGIDRLLLGVAMQEDGRWLGEALPLDDVDSGDIDLAGRFAEFIDRVDAVVRLLEQARTAPQWAGLLGDLVLSLGEPLQAWQAAQLRGELADVAEAARDTDIELGRADVAALLNSRLAGRPTRASFRTGTLTVCTLVPMRSVPHRVVCLLGLDDGAFPRNAVIDGDDVLARDPRTGERDARSEDRQLFLDAICAAEEHLTITYTGADPRSGAVVPPCVPLGELLDAVDAAVLAPDGGPGRGHVVIRHPLQPFDGRNFTPDALGAPGPFSFDPAALAAARAASGTRYDVPALVPRRLGPPPTTDTVELEDLIRFVQHPARAFLRQRLGISTYDEDDDPADALPVDLDGLQTWAVGDRVLRNCLAGMTPASCVQIEQRRGDLPPGPLGQAKLTEIGAHVTALLAACQLERLVLPRSEDVSVTLEDGRRLSGTVGGVRGGTVLAVVYSTLGPKHRLAAWIKYLALVAGRDVTTLQSVTVGRRGGGARRALIGGVDPAMARQVLGELVALRDAGLREPLPMAFATSAEYAGRRHRGDDVKEATAAARAKWAADRFASENAEPEHVLVFGGVQPLTHLLATRDDTWPDDSRPDGSWAHGTRDDTWPDEATRFGALARRLWTPLFNAEIDVLP